VIQNATPLRARALAVRVLLGLGVLAAGASAAPIRFTSMPEARLADVPARSAAPVGLAPSERVAGFESGSPGEPTGVRVGAEGSEKTDQPSRCFVLAHEGVNENEPWPLAAESELVRHHAQHDVVAARSERLVTPRSGRAELQATDAWFDWKTGSARLIERSTVALSRVASGPGGIQVFAARQGKRVHFVVTPPRAPELALDRGSLMGQARQLLLGRSRRDSQLQTLPGIVRTLVISRAGGEVARSECGHARVSLGVDEGGGETARVLADLVVETPQKDEAARTDGRLGVKLRSVAVQLSVSQTSSERAPIPAVSFAWSGKARDI
jgi:hypothetical protein